MTHYRKGQLWTDPTGNHSGYWIKNLDPLELSGWGLAEVRPSREELEALSVEERAAKYPRLHSDPEASPDEIRAGLVGRTITDVVVEKITTDWPQGDGNMILTLDDGNKVRITSWGHDAYGTLAYFERIPIPSGKRVPRAGEASEM